VTYDPAQEEFIRRLGEYQRGRFWAEFNDGMDLGVRITEALRGLDVPAPPLTYLPLAHAIPVAWRRERAALADRNLYALSWKSMPADCQRPAASGLPTG
jgi:hypothetical protein